MDEFFCTVLPLCTVGILVVLLFIFRKRNQKTSSNILNKNLLIKWLKQMKSKGHNTIEDLLELLEPVESVIKSNAENINTTIVEDVQKTRVEQPTEKSLLVSTTSPLVRNIENKNDSIPKIDFKQQLSSATFLLYLGSGLVLFAIFIFVAFNWQNFAPFVKSLIVVLLTVAFYLAGLITAKMPKLKPASGTFLFIGSICLGLTGIGLWNFNETSLLSSGLTFANYWLFYSIILIAVYTSSYYYIKSKSYIYLVATSLYSLIASFTFTLSNDDKFRIVLFALLNLLVFFLHTYTRDFNKVISLASRTINYVLDVVIFFLLFSLLGEINSLSDKMIALFALFIPSIFNLASYFKLKNINDLHILILTSPIKLLLIINIFDLNFTEGILCFSLYLVINTLLKQLNKLPILSTTFEAVTWLIAFPLVFASIFSEPLHTQTFYQNISLILLTGCLTIPYLIKKNVMGLAIGINFLIPTVFKIYVNTMGFDSNYSASLEELHIVSIVLLLTALIMNVYFHYTQQNDFKYSFNPFLLLNSIIIFFYALQLNSERLFITLFLLILTAFIVKFINNRRENSTEKALYYSGLVISHIINIIVLFVALATIDVTSTPLLKITATLAISALPLLNLIRIFEGKVNKESYLITILIPFHILTFCLIYQFSLEHSVIIFTLYSIVKVIVSEFYRSKSDHSLSNNKDDYYYLHVLSQIIFWIILIFTTFFTTSAFINEFNFTFSKLTIVFVYIINLLLFNVPAIIYKRYDFLAITINYLLLVAFRLLGLITTPENTLAYLLTAVVLHLGGLIMHFYINSKQEKLQITFLPFICLSGLAVVLSIFNTTNLYMMLGFTTVAFTTMLVANFHKKDEIKYLGVSLIFFAYGFLLNYLFELIPSNLYLNAESLSFLYILPAIFYMFNFESNYATKILKSNILAIIIFSVFTVIATIDYYRILSLAILLGYAIHIHIKHNWKWAAYFIFFITNLIYLQFTIIKELEYEKLITGIAAISFLFCLPSTFKNFNYPKVLAYLGAITLAVVTAVNIPYFLAQPSNLIIFTSLFATAGLILSDRYSIWFGNIAGLALMSAFWNLFLKYELDNQFYVFTMALYLIYLSFRYFKLGRLKTSFALEFAAYILQCTSLLINSINGSDAERIITGLILIVLSCGIALMGSNRKKKVLLITGIVYLVLELIVRLYVVIISLDWWMYLLIIGIVMIGGAIYIFTRSGENK